MYDERLAEDSLAFVEDLKARWEGQGDPIFSGCGPGEAGRDSSIADRSEPCRTDEPPAYGSGPAGTDSSPADGLDPIGADSPSVVTLDTSEALPPKSSVFSVIHKNILIFVICVAAAYLLATFVTVYIAHPSHVEGESMEPSLSDGDTVIIQKLSYYLEDPKRFDVVVFPIGQAGAVSGQSGGSAGRETYYIKRIIGLPGETLQIVNGCVYIDGVQLASDKYALSDIQEAGIAADPVVLGDGQYFVMGDNRNRSTDSRIPYVGLVERKVISGKAWICAWPPRHFGVVR